MTLPILVILLVIFGLSSAIWLTSFGDPATMHGNNQFSVVLIHDPKKKEKRNPVQTATLKITQGMYLHFIPSKHNACLY